MCILIKYHYYLYGNFLKNKYIHDIHTLVDYNTSDVPFKTL